MTTLSSFSDASKAFYELYDPPAREFDPKCCYCFEECTLGDQRTMTCRAKGSFIEHETHIHCQKNWAEIKSGAGALGSKIHCQYSGVCTTNLAHLLPQKSFWKRAGDFFRDRAAVRILTYGAAMLAVDRAFGPIESLSVGAVPAALGLMESPMEYSGLAAFQAILSGMAERGSNPLFKMIAMGLSCRAGKMSTKGVDSGATRHLLSAAAATAAVVFGSTLIHSGNLFSAASLSLISWGSAIK